jgi:hypothetical protein
MATNEKLALLAEVHAAIFQLALLAKVNDAIDQLKIAEIARRAQLAGGLVWLMPQAE